VNEFTQEQLNALQTEQATIKATVEQNKERGLHNDKTLKALHGRFDGFEKTLIDYEHRLSQAPTQKFIKEEFDNAINRGVASLLWKAATGALVVVAGGVITYITEWWKG